MSEPSGERAMSEPGSPQAERARRGPAATARLLGVGGAIAYRALFNWTTPTMWVASLLVTPIASLVFFAYLGRQLGVADDRFYVVGNAVLSTSVVCVFGGTMAVANERRYGTLSAVLLSPRSRTAIFLGRALPYAANAVLTATVVLAVGCLLFGVEIAPSAWLPLLLVLAVAALSCAFFGLVLGAIGLRLRDLWLISNVSATVLILVSGVNVPAQELPAGLRALGDVLPLKHAAEAARDVASGTGLADVLPRLGVEVLLAVAYALLAAVLLRVFEREGRRSAALDVL